MPYVVGEYPKYKYHPDREPVIVADAAAEAALGDGWFNLPGDAKSAKEKMVAQLKKLEQLRAFFQFAVGRSNV